MHLFTFYLESDGMSTNNVKKLFALPATARNSLPQEFRASQNPLGNPPFCGDKIFNEKRRSTHSISIISMGFT